MTCNFIIFITIIIIAHGQCAQIIEPCRREKFAGVCRGSWISFDKMATVNESFFAPFRSAFNGHSDNSDVYLLRKELFLFNHWAMYFEVATPAERMHFIIEFSPFGVSMKYEKYRNHLFNTVQGFSSGLVRITKYGSASANAIFDLIKRDNHKWFGSRYQLVFYNCQTFVIRMFEQLGIVARGSFDDEATTTEKVRQGLAYHQLHHSQFQKILVVPIMENQDAQVQKCERDKRECVSSLATFVSQHDLSQINEMPAGEKFHCPITHGRRMCKIGKIVATEKRRSLALKKVATLYFSALDHGMLKRMMRMN